MSGKPLITVLGASGFLGTAIARELARRPLRLRLVSRKPAAAPAGAVADIEVRALDLTRPGAVAEAVAGADAVIHLVAYLADGASWRIAEGDTAAEQVNVGLVRTLIEVAGESERKPVVLFAGSTTQAGPSDKELFDGSEPDQPSSPYDRQKLAAEQALKAATAAGLLRAVSLRLPPVFGQPPATTASSKGIVTMMIRRALAGEPLTMWNDGTVRRDLIHVDDVARAFASALENSDALAGRHWLIGTGRGESLRGLFTAIAEAVAEHTGKPPVPVISVPPPDHADDTDSRSIDIDSTAFRSITGWRPEVPLRTALAQTVEGLSPRN